MVDIKTFKMNDDELRKLYKTMGKEWDLIIDYACDAVLKKYPDFGQNGDYAESTALLNDWVLLSVLEEYEKTKDFSLAIKNLKNRVKLNKICDMFDVEHVYDVDIEDARITNTNGLTPLQINYIQEFQNFKRRLYQVK